MTGLNMKGVGRNDPCPCGSGRKYKKCCIGKHPRGQYVYIGYREPFQGVTFDNDQAYVHLPSGEKMKADAVFSQTQYTRTTGKDKVLSSVPYIATLGIPASLASNFDAIWAIDTNTKQINDDMVSISCILECYAKKTRTAQQIKVLYRKHGNMAFKNCPNNESEKFAWFRLVAMITSGQGYSENLRIAVITDHDLSRHSKYNTKELPIYKDFYLPDNFTLVYASSDTGKENILNMLITECDKDATNILKELEEKGTATVGNLTVTIDKIHSPNFD